MVTEIFHYSFMVRALLAGSIIAATAPLIGNFLVIKRLSLIADTLSHIALAGVAIGLLTHTLPIAATVIFTTIVAVIIEKIRTTKNIPGEVVLAMFLPGGLALSLVLLSLAHGFNVNLFSYLFGSITTVSISDLWLTLGLGIITVTTTIFLYKRLLYTSFDEESAQIGGIDVQRVNTLLVVLTAVTVSLSMRVVGVLLIGALMVIPVTTAMQVARSFISSLCLSVAFGLLAVLGGLFLAFYLSLPAGATIVLLSLGIFGIISLAKGKQ